MAKRPTLQMIQPEAMETDSGETDDETDDEGADDGDAVEDDGVTDDEADDDGSGFGIMVALVAALTAVALLRRTRS